MGDPRPRETATRPGRLFRGYGLLAALVVVFTLMAMLVPTVGEQVRVRPGAAFGPGPAADGVGTEPILSASGPAPRPGAAASEAATGAPATAPGRAVTAGRLRDPLPGTPATAPSRAKGPTAAPLVGAGARAGGVGPCPSRAQQVPNDPYSPPCVAFSGDNGGTTSRGVTGDRVQVSVRKFDMSALGSDPDGPAGSLIFNDEQLRDAVSALFEYFNSRFQFYGRKLEPVFWEGKGDILAEFQGAGQEGAEADAVKVAEEIRPFAEVMALTTPFADGLARRQVLNLGALYMSAEWYAERAPYSWSFTPDCTFVMGAISEYLVKRVVGRSADRAGAAYRGKPRRLALIGPENPWYQQCVDVADAALKAAGAPAALRLAYKFDINTLSNQAASLVAKLRNADITTVACLCDPALPIFLTSKAQEQGYEPEYVISGVIFSDNDDVGQIYQQDQWARAFGLSFQGTSQPRRSTYGYFAYKAARPDREPIALIDYIYYHLYVLALGVQMAGPNLTPATFDAGLRSYPGGTGPIGTWRWNPGRYTPTQDSREIYWDRSRTSVVNQQPGSYVETEPGRRHRSGEW